LQAGSNVSWYKVPPKNHTSQAAVAGGEKRGNLVGESHRAKKLLTSAHLLAISKETEAEGGHSKKTRRKRGGNGGPAIHAVIPEVMTQKKGEETSQKGKFPAGWKERGQKRLGGGGSLSTGKKSKKPEAFTRSAKRGCSTAASQPPHDKNPDGGRALRSGKNETQKGTSTQRRAREAGRGHA